jgi:acyl carrier protein
MTTSTQQTALESEVAALIVKSLNLDIAPSDIVVTDPLYGDGLGLDSIDILEMALAISKKYGFQLRSDDPENETIYTSLRSLSVHIAKHKTV